MENGYSVKIMDSSFELSKKDMVKMKDTGNAKKLDEVVTVDESIMITPIGYVILSVHNPKSENPDYTQYLILDANGTKYVTGSPSFWESFIDIWRDMDGDDSEWSLEVYKKDSKNYKGKQFLSCSII